jgi:hypothetical protein
MAYAIDSACRSIEPSLRTAEVMTQKRQGERATSDTALLTAQQAAYALLEAAALQAYRTCGAEGLCPVRDDAGKPMFRPQDVAGFIECRMRSVA